jgi:hypothetical protein
LETIITRAVRAWARGAAERRRSAYLWSAAVWRPLSLVQLASMRVTAGDASRRRTARRWAALTALSVVFHAAVLGAFALRLPASGYHVAPSVMDVSLAPPPFVRPIALAAAPRPEPVDARLTILPTAPRYVAKAQARTGDAGDAADLFGPVFADGVWPRPILVRSEPCDPDEALGADCRRELMLMGVASDAAGGAKAGP